MKSIFAAVLLLSHENDV